MIGTIQQHPLPEQEIICRIIGGEAALFEVLIRRNNPILHKTGMSYGFSHEDTQDLMQETFVNAYTNLAKFEQRSSFKTWITRIMLNNCYQKRQRSGFNKELAALDINENSIPMYTPKQPDPLQTIINRELAHIIEISLAKISLEHRLVFSLRHLNGFNVAETAEVLNITESNVKVRLNRAKSMIRKEIEKNYSPNEIYDFNLVYCDLMVKRVLSRIK